MSYAYQDFTCQDCKRIYRNASPNSKGLKHMKPPPPYKICACGSKKSFIETAIFEVETKAQTMKEPNMIWYTEKVEWPT